MVFNKVFIGLLLGLSIEASIPAEEINEGRLNKSQPATTVVQLTPEEQMWLAKHKSIRIAYDGSLPPYSFINDQGQIDGIAEEIMAILSQRLGIEFNIYPVSNWTGIYKAGARRKVDMIATMVKRPERAEWFRFTKPYLTKSLVIVTKMDNTAIRGRDDLNAKKVAVVKGYQYGAQVKNEFPNINLINVDGMLESLRQVSLGQADAAVLFLGSANYLQSKHHLNNLKVAAFYDRNSANESIAVRKDWPLFVDILQKGLDSLTEEEVQKVFAKWIIGDPQNVTDVSSQKPQSTPAAPAPAPEVPEIPRIKEIEQPPASFSRPVKSVQEKPQEGSKALNLMWLIAGLISVLFVVWLLLLRKQRKYRLKVKHDTQTPVRNLPLERNEEIPITPEKPDCAAGEEFQLLFESGSKRVENGYIYYQHDCEGRFSYVSPSVIELLGYTESDFMANYRNYLTDNPVNRRIDSYTESCIQGQPSEPYEIEIYDANQTPRWLEVMDTPVYNGQGHCIGVDGVMHDITATKQRAVEPEIVNPEPDVTAIEASDRSIVLENVQEAIQIANRSYKPFALIYLAIENIRPLEVTDLVYSEQAVLDEAGKRLKATLRTTDQVLKLNENQYILILPETEMDAVGLIKEKIKKILQIPYLVGIQSVVLNANIGSSVYPGTHNDPAALVAEAKTVLFSIESEAADPNKVGKSHYSPDETIQIQQDLVQALDECKLTLRASSATNINALSRLSPFSVYYQSRHETAGFNIAGFEALIRWQHPELGLLLPKDFVGLIKDIGMLDIMTYWIVQQVSLQALAWEKMGVRPKIMTVNLENLTGKDAVDVNRITTIVQEAGAKPDWLEFSIPEREIAGNPDTVIPIIGQLHAEGFAIAIDNFGSDETLLELIKTIPAQTVEIDPEFIRNLPRNTEDADIVSYTIAMLHELGKTVVAKEVETEEQLECLKKSGCDIIQGHIVSRPLPSKEAKDLVVSLPHIVWYLGQK